MIPYEAALRAVVAGTASMSAFLATIAEQVALVVLPVTPEAGAGATVTPMKTVAAVAAPPVIATDCLGF